VIGNIHLSHLFITNLLMTATLIISFSLEVWCLSWGEENFSEVYG